MSVPVPSYIDERVSEYCDDPEFAAWMAQVDARFEKRFGLSVFDMVDYCWRDAYDDGLTPAGALRMAIEDGLLE